MQPPESANLAAIKGDLIDLNVALANVASKSENNLLIAHERSWQNQNTHASICCYLSDEALGKKK